MACSHGELAQQYCRPYPNILPAGRFVLAAAFGIAEKDCSQVLRPSTLYLSQYNGFDASDDPGRRRAQSRVTGLLRATRCRAWPLYRATAQRRQASKHLTCGHRVAFRNQKRADLVAGYNKIHDRIRPRHGQSGKPDCRGEAALHRLFNEDGQARLRGTGSTIRRNEERGGDQETRTPKGLARSAFGAYRMPWQRNSLR